jgi:hypothetical protein
MNSLLLTTLFTLCCLLSQAQQSIKGTVKDKSGSPLAGVTILIKNEKNLVLKYAVTNTKGEFSLVVADTVFVKKTNLEVKHISYQSLQQLIEKGKFIYNFTMDESAEILSQVVVKQPPIITRGDTTRYKVSSFAKDEDRSIADVIKRMPGLDIDESGKIYYNGKEISNLYMHDDDLMDGRYGGATKVIKKEMIESVDVIQNHQPVKVLRNKKPTDNIGLNLVLKDENSWALSGQAMIGIGAPKLLTSNLNTVLLNKKVKTLNTLKINNTGEDYRNEITRMGGFTENQLSASSSQLLSSGTAGNPDLPRRNYYFNRSGLANINFLVNTKNQFQFRTNIQAFTDRQTQEYNSFTELYTATDTIRYFEQQNIQKKPWILNGAFTIMANKEKYYLSNRLTVEAEGIHDPNQLTTHQNSFSQNLRQKPFTIANAFNFTPSIKQRGILDFAWSFNYSKRPQQLYVDDGLHADILNNGIPYTAMRQTADMPAFKNRIATNYLISKGIFRQQYSAVLLQENKELNSDLLLQQNNHNWTLVDSTTNRLKWNNTSATFTALYGWSKKGKYETSISLPLILQSIRYQQEEFSMKEQQKRVWFTPSLSARWYTSTEDFLQLSYSFNNSISDINSIYRAVILTNYRSLQANNAILQEAQSHQAGIRYNLQRTIQMFFLNAGITYSREKVNSILAYSLTDDVQESVLLPVPNIMESIQGTLGGSKYSYFLKSTISVKTAYGETNSRQLINDELIPTKFNTLSGSLGLDTRLFKRINFNYNGSLSYQTMKQQIKNSTSSKMYRIDQQFTATFNLFKDFLFQVQARNISSWNNSGSDVQYWFADAKVRYNLKKWKTDIELDCTNLANVNEYELLRVTAGMSSMSRYLIRGRMALIKFTFQL